MIPNLQFRNIVKSLALCTMAMIVSGFFALPLSADESSQDIIIELPSASQSSGFTVQDAEGAVLWRMGADGTGQLKSLTQEQREALTNPQAGWVVFQTDGIAGLYFYYDQAWRLLGDDAISLDDLVAPGAQVGSVLTDALTTDTLLTESDGLVRVGLQVDSVGLASLFDLALRDQDMGLDRHHL